MERLTDGTETSIRAIPITEIRKRNRARKFVRIMKRYKEVACLLLTTVIFFFTKSGHSFHEKQIQRPAPLPRKFFPSHSNVVDYHFGELVPVIKLLEDEELIFVMYYAPWCAESVRVRGEFMKAAKVIGDAVKFVAVNCWWPKGVCRDTMKFLSYPELYVYHTGVADGYRFTGIREAEYLIRFAESFLKPLQPLHTTEEIEEFVSEQDTTVVGYFDFNTSPQPPGKAFQQFYLSALRVMSYSIYQPIKFGIVLTKQLAQYFDLASPNRFVMVRNGNTTLKYPVYHNMTSRNISSWILRNKAKNYVSWLVPPGVKSLTLSLPMKQGPALFMFAPSNPLMEHNFYLEVLRELSLVYHSSQNSGEQSYPNSEQLIQQILQNRRKLLQNVRNLVKDCSNKPQRTQVLDPLPKYSSKCCMSILTGANSNSRCEYCVSNINKDRKAICDISWKAAVESAWFPAQISSCSESYQFYNINEHRSLCCNQCHSGISQNLFLETGKTRRRIDPFVVYGQDRTFQRQCHKLALQKSKRLLSADSLEKRYSSENFKSVRNFTGLYHRTNRTLKFYYIDSHYQSVFAEKLGITTSSIEPKVLITDLKNEGVYVLREKFSLDNVAQFILNFTEGGLERHTRSSEGESPGDCDPSLGGACIVDVTSQTFQKVVMDNTKDVVLLYYASWCGFCSQFARIYLTAAEYFQKNRNLIFARINADVNDLPWEYTVETYPTILFFPAKRKSESMLFPEDVEKSLANLIQFIMHHTNKSTQLDVAMSVCSTDCMQQNIARTQERRIQLETRVRQLDRRARMLWSHVQTGSLKYVKMASETVLQMLSLRNNQLRKVQLLNHFLQNNSKKIEKELLQDLISAIR